MYSMWITRHDSDAATLDDECTKSGRIAATPPRAGYEYQLSNDTRKPLYRESPRLAGECGGSTDITECRSSFWNPQGRNNARTRP